MENVPFQLNTWKSVGLIIFFALAVLFLIVQKLSSSKLLFHFMKGQIFPVASFMLFVHQLIAAVSRKGTNVFSSAKK